MAVQDVGDFIRAFRMGPLCVPLSQRWRRSMPGGRGLRQRAAGARFVAAAKPGRPAADAFARTLGIAPLRAGNIADIDSVEGRQRLARRLAVMTTQWSLGLGLLVGASFIILALAV